MYKTIIRDPLDEVDEVLSSIEERRKDNEACVSAQNDTIREITEVLYDEFNSCGIVAARSSADVVNDVSGAIQQLVYEGLDVLSTYKKCEKKKNPVMKDICYAKLTVKGTLYIVNAKRSIKILKKAKNERVPAIFQDANLCTHTAADKALRELSYVNFNIDLCNMNF